MMQIIGESVLATGLGRTVPVGTGVPAGAKHSRPASHAPRDYREFVDANHTSYQSYKILFLFAITFENRYKTALFV